MPPSPEFPPDDEALRRLAEERIRKEKPPSPEGDSRRILHELQVHQIELEMQNAELLSARCRLEELVDKYTDLYDFAPVGYFSLDSAGRMQEMNLQGATMLGVDRSSLLRQRFSGFVANGYKSAFEGFLRNVFGESEKQAMELIINTGGKAMTWVDLQAKSVVSPVEGERLCRLAVSEITAQKRAEEAQLRVEELEAVATKLRNEISRRKTVEKSLLKSKKKQGELLKKSKQMEEEFRLLSHQVLHTLEEERKHISHDLHDEIAQSLVAINVQLSSLAKEAALKTYDFAQSILETQKIVEESVESVHRFAMGLRPTHLDHFGLLQALRTYIKDFKEQTKISVTLGVPRKVKPLDDTRSLVLFRVAQAALTNIAQHAHATEVKLTMRQTQRSVSMTINDNGKSFNVERALIRNTVNRLGLIGMRERVEMIGGAFSVTSTPGEGTTIRATLPDDIPKKNAPITSRFAP
jgi:PAS domain S-box-containing protein